MDKTGIVETYTYEDGAVVHIADSAFRDKTPDQLSFTWEMVQKAAIDCIRAPRIQESAAKQEPNSRTSL